MPVALSTSLSLLRLMCQNAVDGGLNRNWFFQSSGGWETQTKVWSRFLGVCFWWEHPSRLADRCSILTVWSHCGERRKGRRIGRGERGQERVWVLVSLFYCLKKLSNLLGWRWSMQPHRFQVCSSVTHHLHSPPKVESLTRRRHLTPLDPLSPPHWGVLSYKDINPVGPGAHPYDFI